MRDNYPDIRGPRVYRQPASATWEHEHRWGVQLGDSTTLTVTRRDGGALTIRYGKETTMSEAYWVAWAVLTIINAAVWLATTRNLRVTRRLLDECPTPPEDPS